MHRGSRTRPASAGAAHDHLSCPLLPDIRGTTRSLSAGHQPRLPSMACINGTREGTEQLNLVHITNGVREDLSKTGPCRKKESSTFPALEKLQFANHTHVIQGSGPTGVLQEVAQLNAQLQQLKHDLQLSRDLLSKAEKDLTQKDTTLANLRDFNRRLQTALTAAESGCRCGSTVDFDAIRTDEDISSHVINCRGIPDVPHIKMCTEPRNGASSTDVNGNRTPTVNRQHVNRQTVTDLLLNYTKEDNCNSWKEYIYLEQTLSDGVEKLVSMQHFTKCGKNAVDNRNAKIPKDISCSNMVPICEEDWCGYEASVPNHNECLVDKLQGVLNNFGSEKHVKGARRNYRRLQSGEASSPTPRGSVGNVDNSHIERQGGNVDRDACSTFHVSEATLESIEEEVSCKNAAVCDENECKNFQANLSGKTEDKSNDENTIPGTDTRSDCTTGFREDEDSMLQTYSGMTEKTVHVNSSGDLDFLSRVVNMKEEESDDDQECLANEHDSVQGSWELTEEQEVASRPVGLAEAPDVDTVEMEVSLPAASLRCSSALSALSFAALSDRHETYFVDSGATSLDIADHVDQGRTDTAEPGILNHQTRDAQGQDRRESVLIRDGIRDGSETEDRTQPTLRNRDEGNNEEQDAVTTLTRTAACMQEYHSEDAATYERRLFQITVPDEEAGGRAGTEDNCRDVGGLESRARRSSPEAQTVADELTNLQNEDINNIDSNDRDQHEVTSEPQEETMALHQREAFLYANVRDSASLQSDYRDTHTELLVQDSVYGASSVVETSEMENTVVDKAGIEEDVIPLAKEAETIRETPFPFSGIFEAQTENVCGIRDSSENPEGCDRSQENIQLANSPCSADSVRTSSGNFENVEETLDSTTELVRDDEEETSNVKDVAEEVPCCSERSTTINEHELQTVGQGKMSTGTVDISPNSDDDVVEVTTAEETFDNRNEHDKEELRQEETDSLQEMTAVENENTDEKEQLSEGIVETVMDNETLFPRDPPRTEDDEGTNTTLGGSSHAESLTIIFTPNQVEQSHSVRTEEETDGSSDNLVATASRRTPEQSSLSEEDYAGDINDPTSDHAEIGERVSDAQDQKRTLSGEGGRSSNLVPDDTESRRADVEIEKESSVCTEEFTVSVTGKQSYPSVQDIVDAEEILEDTHKAARASSTEHVHTHVEERHASFDNTEPARDEPEDEALVSSAPTGEESTDSARDVPDDNGTKKTRELRNFVLERKQSSLKELPVNTSSSESNCCAIYGIETECKAKPTSITLAEPDTEDDAHETEPEKLTPTLNQMSVNEMGTSNQDTIPGIEMQAGCNTDEQFLPLRHSASHTNFIKGTAKNTDAEPLGGSRPEVVLEESQKKDPTRSDALSFKASAKDWTDDGNAESSPAGCQTNGCNEHRSSLKDNIVGREEEVGGTFHLYSQRSDDCKHSSEDLEGEGGAWPDNTVTAEKQSPDVLPPASNDSEGLVAAQAVETAQEGRDSDVCKHDSVQSTRYGDKFEERIDFPTSTCSVSNNLRQQREMHELESTETQELVTDIVKTDFKSLGMLQKSKQQGRPHSAVRVSYKAAANTNSDTVKSYFCPKCEVSEAIIKPQHISREISAIPRKGLGSGSHNTSVDVAVQASPDLCSRGVQTYFADDVEQQETGTAEGQQQESNELMKRIEVLQLSEGLLLAQVATVESERKDLLQKSRRLRDELHAWQETVQQQRVLLEQLKEEMEQNERILAAEKRASEELRHQLHALQTGLRSAKADREIQTNEDFGRESHESGVLPVTVKRLARMQRRVTPKGSCDCFHEYYESVKEGCVCDGENAERTLGREAVLKRQGWLRTARRERRNFHAEEEKVSALSDTQNGNLNLSKQTQLLQASHRDAAQKIYQKHHDGPSAHPSTRSPQPMLDLLRMQNELERKMQVVRKTEQQFRLAVTPKKYSRRTLH